MIMMYNSNGIAQCESANGHLKQSLILFWKHNVSILIYLVNTLSKTSTLTANLLK